MKDYISVQEAAEKWKISVRRVNKYCTDGRINGLVRFGRSWCIPVGTVKPQDLRLAKKEDSRIKG